MPYQARTCVVCKSPYRGYHNSLACSPECRRKSRSRAVASAERNLAGPNVRTKAITIKLTAAEHERIRVMAADQGREMAALIRDAIRAAGLLANR